MDRIVPNSRKYYNLNIQRRRIISIIVSIILLWKKDDINHLLYFYYWIRDKKLHAIRLIIVW